MFFATFPWWPQIDNLSLNGAGGTHLVGVYQRFGPPGCIRTMCTNAANYEH
jgi:hypothetical protein